jgi:ubiquinone/menaquinone biosynthesis C-methylase UbiE
MTAGTVHARSREAQGELIRRVLSCPDCSVELNADLSCGKCGRSFVAQSDGVISALPKGLEELRQSKEEIQDSIDSGRSGTDSVAMYERAFHDEQAAYYDRLFADPQPVRSYYKWLVRNAISAQVRNCEFIVDLCCGTGKSSIPLAEAGLPVVAVDVSREMLRAYKRKCAQRGLSNVVFIHADASLPPLRPNSCPAITMIGGLHHIHEQAACVNVCGSALQPGGVLVLHEPLKSGCTSSLARMLSTVYTYMDLPRVWRAVRRRLGANPAPAPAANETLCDFTPYEKPFSSARELNALMPDYLSVVVLRSQGSLSFRELPPMLQNSAGSLIAAVIVRIDAWLSSREQNNWSGDAIFGAWKKK